MFPRYLSTIKDQRVTDISLRTKQLNSPFSYDKKTGLEESHLEIIPSHLTQARDAGEIDEFQRGLTPTGFCPMTDDRVQENKFFSYAIFTPSRHKKNNEAIILLHGLNEQTQEKYLTWMEHPTRTTGKSVILLPIVFHMSRTPGLWANPRTILPWVSERKEEVANVTNSTLANVAPSNRLSQNPLRFCASDRGSVHNMWQLTHKIKNGEYPLFKEDTFVSLFAYSIGALPPQVLLLANPDRMFMDARLLTFCGGSISSETDGSARDVMGKKTFTKVRHYFRHDFPGNRTLPTSFKDSFLGRAFKVMTRKDVLRGYRESFFQRAYNHTRAIPLRKGIAIPTGGVIKALGKAFSEILEELDFPFAYSYQVPFPIHSHINPGLVNRALHLIFMRVATSL